VRAGRVSAAALVANSTIPTEHSPPRHCPEAAYVAHVEAQGGNRQYRLAKLRFYRAFLRCWPDLADWFAAPLVERVGRLPGEPHVRPSWPVSFRARPYCCSWRCAATPRWTTRGCSVPGSCA
jgi:hypothetical protein